MPDAHATTLPVVIKEEGRGSAVLVTGWYVLHPLTVGGQASTPHIGVRHIQSPREHSTYGIVVTAGETAWGTEGRLVQ